MANLTDVYDIATDYNVGVLCFDMMKSNSFSCETPEGDCFVAIDPMQLESTAEEKVLLAHELGHCVTGSFYNVHNYMDVRGRHEYRADRWAVEQLIPWPELHAALEDGQVEAWQLAEYFDVPQDFISTVLNVYRRQGKLL